VTHHRILSAVVFALALTLVGAAGCAPGPSAALLPVTLTAPLSTPLPPTAAPSPTVPSAVPPSTPRPTAPPTLPPATKTSSPPTATSRPIPTPAPATARPTSTLAPTAAPVLKVETLVSGLEAPWALDFAPDGRIFLTERGGRIRIIQDGKLLPQPWLTLDVAATGEAGLLGLALDPGFAQNGFVYVAYTTRVGAGLQNRLVRLREDPATGQGVLDRVLLEGIPGNGNHDGGRVKFGPDGKLYWTMGDAQTGAAAQDRSSLNGKILRLNPDGTIPADNPFPGSPVYSYGHRNPQGLAWQPGTGRLYATEHGPSGVPSCCHDELNFIEPGKNYGWPTIIGDQTRPGLVSPVLQSGNAETWAPSGATFVTTGPWAGSLLFAGLRGESLYRVVLDVADPRRVILFERLLAQQYGRLRDVEQGPDGALYVLTSNLDGRGAPPPDGDRVLRLSFAAP
jgi:aldose sugar dehydrogenase